MERTCEAYERTNASEIGNSVRHRSVRNYQGVYKTPDFGRCSDVRVGKLGEGC